jgi:hypothetical protein
MDTVDHKEEHLDQVIAQAMGGEAPVVNPPGVEAPTSIPIHAVDELPQDCHGHADNLEDWTHPTKLTLDASAGELTRHAQYLEWRAGLLTGKAEALRATAATR